MRILVNQVSLCALHANLLQVVEESLIAVSLNDVQLMRVPHLCENLLYIVLVHAKVH